MLGNLTKLLQDKRIDILTMTFSFIHKLRNVGGPHLREALGRGLLGLCLKMALLTTSFVGAYWNWMMILSYRKLGGKTMFMSSESISS